MNVCRHRTFTNLTKIQKITKVSVIEMLIYSKIEKKGEKEIYAKNMKLV